MFSQCKRCGSPIKFKRHFFNDRRKYTCEKCGRVEVYDKFGLFQEWEDGKKIMERKLP
jgi:ribosomal protein S14